MKRSVEMKKLNDNTMKKVFGGDVNYNEDCTGWNFDYRTYHSIPIKGHGSNREEAQADFNENLRTHKENTYFKNFYHSAKPF